MPGTTDRGKRGELLAASYIRTRGYAILESNYKTALGEIDLIAHEGGSTVFIEVKTRLSSSLGPPYLSVTWKKRRKIIQNALCYLKQKRLDSIPWRIDIVSLKLGADGEMESIELFKNAIEDIPR